MFIKYDASYNGYNHHIKVDEPSECPCCKHSLKPTVLHTQLIENNENILNFYAMYLCTHCYSAFICVFSELIKDENSSFSYTAKKLSLIEPNVFQEKIFEKHIKDLSPDFVTIYNQAFKAEHLKLDQISGIGYRKALEFLIKDFLIKHELKDESKVKSTALGCCIDTMIDNPQLKAVASRATWLGNDQTHYEQKYSDNDIQDLKRLIDLSVHWISMIYLTDDAQLIQKI